MGTNPGLRPMPALGLVLGNSSGKAGGGRAEEESPRCCNLF